MLGHRRAPSYADLCAGSGGPYRRGRGLPKALLTALQPRDYNTTRDGGDDRLGGSYIRDPYSLSRQLKIRCHSVATGGG